MKKSGLKIGKVNKPTAGFLRRQQIPNRFEHLKEMKEIKDLNEIAKKLTKLSGIDPFKNDRSRAYVEQRALMTYIAYHAKGLTLKLVREWFEMNGKRYDHATALHALNNFEMYRKYNKNLNEYLAIFLQPENQREKLTILRSSLLQLNDENLNKVYDIVKIMHEEEIKQDNDPNYQKSENLIVI